MNQSCRQCKHQFEVTEDDQVFYDKMKVPVPALCPDCRLKRRFFFRNEMTLYSRPCDLCKKTTIAMFHPKSPYTVYCKECFDSDKWDPFSYGMDYDPKRPFFEQLNELFLKVPKKNLYASSASAPSVNSDYLNMAGSCKDSYLVFNTAYCENTMFSRGLARCKDTLDAYFGNENEGCYEIINVNKSFNVHHGQNLVNSLDCIFAMSLADCQNCFGCINLRHKSFNFFNEQLSKDEYMKRVNEISAKEGKDCYDAMGHTFGAELMLDVVGCGFGSRVIGSYWVENCNDVEYSYCINVSDYCLGCDGLNKTKYAILNKKYSPEEYTKLRSKIIEELKSLGEYGLCMPPFLSPSGYNETFGMDNVPLTKGEVLALGGKWQDDLPGSRGKETMKSNAIPDHIYDVPNSILNEILGCVTCGKNYRIIKQELAFYRKAVLPLPRKCFTCRNHERVLKRGPLKLFDRKCGKCQKGIKTSYAPYRPEIVWCESCYQKEVV
ncbi:hypothetical protein HY224_00135 [Candidatus Uhrbacteria bacterium]|nr:hypothetical protein [Candidatus Uhrbacteria bacterium]